MSLAPSLARHARMLCFPLVTLCVLAPSTAADRALRMSTTTSTENSGLLGHILPQFEKASGIKVSVIAVGSGKALELGRRGDVDVMLVHAPEAEKKLVADGYGVERRGVMYNDFLIVGPKSDPAGIRGGKDVLAAMERIAASDKARFVSRGDNSGTDMMEQSYWKSIGRKPQGAAYISAGQGMGKVLSMAAEMGAYTLTDRGTWASFGDKGDLEELVEGDPRLFNPYAVIAVNPERHPHVNFKGALQFIEWLTSTEGQTAIAAYRVNGQQLFVPSAHTAGASYAEGEKK